MVQIVLNMEALHVDHTLTEVALPAVWLPWQLPARHTNTLQGSGGAVHPQLWRGCSYCIARAASKPGKQSPAACA